MKSFTQFMPLSVDKLFKFSSSLRLIDINDGGRPSKELARAVIFFLLYIFDWEYTLALANLMATPTSLTAFLTKHARS